MCLVSTLTAKRSPRALQVAFNGTDFSIVGASHMTIRGTPTTTLYFDTGYGTRVLSCHTLEDLNTVEAPGFIRV